MRKILLTLIVFAAASLGAQNALAEAWVAKMFADQSHDFGNVARGANTAYKFAAKNIYKQDIELISVRSSCGCTSPTIEKKVLKTGDIGYVTATFNTRTFTGLHGATLTVEVRWNDKGVMRRGETQLRVNGNIRGDVVFKPGAVRFENVDQGKVSEQVVEVSYGGRSSWKIVDVRGVSDDLEVELTQKRRNSGRVTYDLLVRLKDTAAAGYFNEQLVLITNDEQYPRIPMHIAGRVVPEISVAPEPLLLGEVAHGGQVSKKVLVRGKKPFRIVSVQSDAEDCFQFKADGEPNERHIVEIIFDAKKQVGPVKQTISIATDLGVKYNATLTAYATIVPGSVEPATAQPSATAIQIEAGTASAAGSDRANVAR
ncbi:MAG: DUF1573 domain-containing protein [Planctomycetes bacterium]|nr:DUF1573 domain-containing protein [Planctomycetota bacterium]